MEGIKVRKWNYERFIVFTNVILKRPPEVKRARENRRKIEERLQSWKEAKYYFLVHDTMCTSLSLITKKRGEMMEAQIKKTYNRICLEGKLRAAVRFLTERDKGGVCIGMR